jgi:hypothetical protein
MEPTNSDQKAPEKQPEQQSGLSVRLLIRVALWAFLLTLAWFYHEQIIYYAQYGWDFVQRNLQKR